MVDTIPDAGKNETLSDSDARARNRLICGRVEDVPDAGKNERILRSCHARDRNRLVCGRVEDVPDAGKNEAFSDPHARDRNRLICGRVEDKYPDNLAHWVHWSLLIGWQRAACSSCWVYFLM